MPPSISTIHSLKGAWDVFLLFTIPIGGGIPAGVLMAKNLHLAWPITVAVYFISDVALSFVFEPLMLVLIEAGKRSSSWGIGNDAIRQSLKKSISQYGTNLSPIALIVVAFGVDPMTGRAIAKASGHGFVTGWMLAITGDVLYFMVLMASTLWLNNILGNGIWTTAVMLVLMFVGPSVVRRVRARWQTVRVLS